MTRGSRTRSGHLSVVFSVTPACTFLVIGRCVRSRALPGCRPLPVCWWATRRSGWRLILGICESLLWYLVCLVWCCPGGVAVPYSVVSLRWSGYVGYISCIVVGVVNGMMLSDTLLSLCFRWVLECRCGGWFSPSVGMLGVSSLVLPESFVRSLL